MAAVAAVMFAGGGCSSDGTDDNAQARAFVSFNAGLAPGLVPYSDERASQTLDAIANLDTDVVCFQEVWETKNIDALKTRTASKWPQTYIPAPEPDPNPKACSANDLRPILDCVTACQGKSGLDLAACVASNCQSVPSGGCLECVGSNATGGAPGVVNSCVSYAYGGSYGTGLIARSNLDDQDMLRLDSVLSRRAVLYARTRLTDGRDADVFCTHTTAVFEGLPYPGTQGSWQAELQNQMNAIARFVADKRHDDRVTIIMGDFNAGPAGNGVVMREQAAYDTLINAGYRSPYVEQVGLCTDCPDNPLQVSASQPAMIDHIFIPRDGGPNTTSERILADPISVTFKGEVKDARYSDHYGVRVVLQP